MNRLAAMSRGSENKNRFFWGGALFLGQDAEIVAELLPLRSGEPVRREAGR